MATRLSAKKVYSKVEIILFHQLLKFIENRIEFISSIKPKKYTPRETKTEKKNKKLLEKVREDLANDAFIEVNDDLINWSKNAAYVLSRLSKIVIFTSDHYGYRKRTSMVRCARDTRDAELAESFVQLKEQHLPEAIKDPIGLLKCDIGIKIVIPLFTNKQRAFVNEKVKQIYSFSI